jgi:hypothetical protein
MRYEIEIKKGPRIIFKYSQELKDAIDYANSFKDDSTVSNVEVLDTQTAEIVYRY